MHILNQVWQVVGSHVSRLFNQTKDPETLLNEAIEQMQSDLIELRQVIADARETEKQIEQDYIYAEKTADEWHKRAQLGLKKGSEPVAREALIRRKSYLHTASQMREQLQIQQQILSQLKYHLTELSERAANAKTQRNLYRSRSYSREASERLNQLVQNFDYTRIIERLEEQAIELELRSPELISLGDEYNNDNYSDAEIEAELNAIKAQIRWRSH
ncbi:MAG: PspA/IM30 family protein [Arthrospira sp. PLM2.Bin9]|nr:PspA/IM30 family protein [Arthrospira sp. PLM2.Bin9]TVU55646.1 MAG: PspA/IM30 family protein [Arthrospira sp. PLM2.Bin9]